MRVTSELLLGIAEETVARRTKAEPGVVAAYLHGTVLEDDPLLGGATDVDLVIVHEYGEERREIARVTDELHLDIEHHPKSLYRQARDLRQRPWLGFSVYSYKTLYDPQHLLDFAQASVRGLFHQPENVLGRAEPQLQQARRLWLGLNGGAHAPGPSAVRDYLRALERAANAVACLSGPPLTERRFLLRYPERAEAAGQPGLYHGLQGLLGGNEVDGGTLAGWLPAWEQAYQAAGERDGAPARLHRDRQAYYRLAFDAILEGERPQDALWPLLNTWTQAVGLLHEGSSAAVAWTGACRQLNLLGVGFEARLAGLDAYLDTVEEVFEGWKGEHGL